MPQLLIEVDEELLARLEKFAPARSRKRSEFIRTAIRQALWEREEQATREAYQRIPDRAEDAYLDPTVWEPTRRPKR